MDKAIEIEEKLFGSCFESYDQKEGMGAFLEKRKVEKFLNRWAERRFFFTFYGVNPGIIVSC